ncbi:DUF3558 domain-containing protein [Actinokineospora sp. HUAS TT18]|uniref:DUF3558 domain-containing protein n=1 Tax=Actinokineospora sp. HUAS TT18 TaxID=3447451 RepID=UPI003F51F881
MRTRLLPLIACVLTLASCTSESPGTPTAAPVTSTDDSTTAPSPTTKETSSGDLPTDGAPKVNTPIEPGRFLKQPCPVFTEAQRKELGINAGESLDGALGEGCKWRSNGGGLLTLTFLEKNTKGLSAPYANNKTGAFKYFDPTEIGGQPAVFASADDRRDQGQCLVIVGMSDKLIFNMFIEQSADKVSPDNKPCDVVARVAGMALTTIKAG